jgi:predicted kinase
VRKKLVAVIGYGKSGKSTIIQSLTGCESRSFEGVVSDLADGQSIYVHTASPQEKPETDEERFKIILKQVVKDAAIQGLVIAIQPTMATARLRMEVMFQLAKKAGLLNYAFILDPPRNDASINFEYVSKRVLEGDPDASVFKLNGRRFAILNAEAIRALSRIPF